MERYSIDQTTCTFCGGCAAVCRAMAIRIEDTRSAITDRCRGCGNCLAFCPVSAVKETEGAPDV